MTNNSYTTSIALCTYNGAPFIHKQIDSYLRQTHLPDEIVVCDDGSSDDTLRIVQGYATANPRIRWTIVVNERKLGASRNFEKAIGHCTGDIIFLSDQDDIWEDHKITEVVAFFKLNAQCGACFTNASLIDEKDTPLAGTLLDTTFFKKAIREKSKPEDLLYLCFMMGNMMTGATMAIRSSMKEEIFPFHLDLGRKLWHDGWIGLSLMAKEYVYYIDQLLIQYRVHAAQQIGVVPRNDPFEKYLLYNDHSQKNVKEDFQRYLSAFSTMQNFRKIKPVKPDVEERILTEYLEHRKKYFATQSFISKKLRLLKWYLRGINYISFKDLMTL